MFGLGVLGYFLLFPIAYIVICIVQYFVLAANDKKEMAWEEAYEKWQEAKKAGDTE